MEWQHLLVTVEFVELNNMTLLLPAKLPMNYLKLSNLKWVVTFFVLVCSGAVNAALDIEISGGSAATDSCGDRAFCTGGDEQRAECE